MRVYYSSAKTKVIWFHEPYQSYTPPAILIFTEGECHNIAEIILEKLDKQYSEMFYNFKGGYIRIDHGSMYIVRNHLKEIDMRFSDDLATGKEELTKFLRTLFKEEDNENSRV